MTDSSAANVLLLVLLYAIQGIPLGLSLGSVPFLLRNVASYTDVGIFTFASYPYSLKLFWSPIVDSIFIKWLGRRKSWIIPIQLVVGCIFIVISGWMDEFMAQQQSREQVVFLTVVFFFIVFLVATQDIAVDGWAISLLPESHRSLASTSQSIGLNIGFFASYTIFLAASSSEFSNKWIRSYLGFAEQDKGILTLGEYMRFSGWVMIIVTVFLFFKSEYSSIEAQKQEYEALKKMNIKSVYQDMWKVIKLPSMKTLFAMLLTSKIAFSAADNISLLKLSEKGFPQEMMALSVVITFPFEIFFPIILGKMAQRAPLKTLGPYILGYPCKLALCLVGMFLIHNFPSSENITTWTYVQVMGFQIVYSLVSNMLFVSQCAFFARICDESIGGTYMTLLNTIANLGGTWPKFFVLYLADLLTIKDLDSISQLSFVYSAFGIGKIDGFYLVGIICVVFGAVWYYLNSSKLIKLQGSNVLVWRVRGEDVNTKAK